MISFCDLYYIFCVDRLYFYLALFLFHFYYCINLNLFDFSFSFIFIYLGFPSNTYILFYFSFLEIIENHFW